MELCRLAWLWNRHHSDTLVRSFACIPLFTTTENVYNDGRQFHWDERQERNQQRRE